MNSAARMDYVWTPEDVVMVIKIVETALMSTTVPLTTPLVCLVYVAFRSTVCQFLFFSRFSSLAYHKSIFGYLYIGVLYLQISQQIFFLGLFNYVHIRLPCNIILSCFIYVAIVLSTDIVQLAAPISSNVPVDHVYQTLSDVMGSKTVQTGLTNRNAVSVAFKCAYMINFILQHITLLILIHITSLINKNNLVTIFINT